MKCMKKIMSLTMAFLLVCTLFAGNRVVTTAAVPTEGEKVAWSDLTLCEDSAATARNVELALQGTAIFTNDDTQHLVASENSGFKFGASGISIGFPVRADYESISIVFSFTGGVTDKMAQLGVSAKDMNGAETLLWEGEQTKGVETDVIIRFEKVDSVWSGQYSTDGGTSWTDCLSTVDSSSIQEIFFHRVGGTSWVKEFAVYATTGACARIGDKAYADFDTALNEAVANDTIKLYKSVNIADEYITKDITIDLNGKTFTADSLVTFDADIIDTSAEKTGLLVCDNLMISNNSQIPVWDTSAGGYRLANVTISDKAVTNSSGAPIEFKTRPDFGADSIHALLVNGSDDSKVEIGVRVEWQGADGTQYVQNCYFSKDVLAQMYGNTENAYGATFALPEADNYTNITATPFVSSAVGVEKLGKAHTPGEIIETPVAFAMPNVFSSNMVLQRNMPINIWGYATGGKEVSATLGTQTKTVVAQGGQWSITFDEMDTARGLTLTVKCEGEEDIVFNNVAIGEVILAAGQSNMNLKVKKATNTEEVISDTSVMDDIRFMVMPKTGHLDPQTDADTTWSVVTSSSVGEYSAVGYMTAYNLAKEQNIPVGVIEACVGGHSIEAFMNIETLKSREMYEDYYINFYETQRASGEDPADWKYYPTGVYNTMLHPIKGMAIGSCVWYQGENNRAMEANNYRPTADYEYLLYDFINMTRGLFNNEDMPFVVCQLANYASNDFILLRQIQLDTVQKMDKVYLVSTSDIGSTNVEIEDDNMIHPTNKVPVGYRAALCIMGDKYGYEGEYHSPLYESMTVEDNKAVLTFTHADGLKMVPMIEGENTITGFEISADGEEFVAATAELGEDNTVIVYADGITNPTTVRYCYTTFAYYDADGNLCSGKGISASKFLSTYIPLGCESKGHLGGNLYNGVDLPLGPFEAVIVNQE